MSNVTSETRREGQPLSKDCLSEAQILRLMEGSLNESEAEAVQAHLDSCHDCFDLVAAVMEYSLNPPTEEEVTEFEKNYKPNFQAVIAKLVPKTQEVSAPKRPLAELPSPFVPKPVRIPTYWRPILAVAATLLLGISVGLPQYNRLQSNRLAEQGFAQLVSSVNFDDAEQPRPAGKFNYDEFEKVRNRDIISQNQPALQKFQSALDHKNDNPKAHQYLGTYYLLVEQDLQKAEEHYRRAHDLSPDDASILNDLGVLAWHKRQDEEALGRFTSAVQRNPRFVEARYNLATLYQKQGMTPQALSAWEKYLALDSTSTWANVAKDQVAALRNP